MSDYTNIELHDDVKQRWIASGTSANDVDPNADRDVPHVIAITGVAWRNIGTMDALGYLKQRVRFRAKRSNGEVYEGYYRVASIKGGLDIVKLAND